MHEPDLVQSKIRRITRSQLGQAFAAVFTVDTVRSGSTNLSIWQTGSLALDQNPEDARFDYDLLGFVRYALSQPSS